MIYPSIFFRSSMLKISSFNKQNSNRCRKHSIERALLFANKFFWLGATAPFKYLVHHVLIESNNSEADVPPRKKLSSWPRDNAKLGNATDPVANTKHSVSRHADRLICKANTAIRIKFVYSADDLIEHKESNEEFFRPVYTHQMFEEEEINGYENLRIILYISQPHLYTYVNIRYDRKEEGCDDVLAILKEWMKGGFTTDKDEFLQQLKHKKQKENVSIYEIWHGGIGNEAIKTYHDRLQFLSLLSIETCSYIDTNDDRWEVMILFEKNVCTQTYKCIGYLTLYSFFAFPSGYRLRISQVLVFPPFQRYGHGFELLQYVYFMAKRRQFLEVTVEDPAEGFRLLRDITDLFNADICQVFKYETDLRLDENDIAATGSFTIHYMKMKTKKVLTFHPFVLKCSSILRITEEQARIVFETILFEKLDKNDEKSCKDFRLFVKKRLMKVLLANEELDVKNDQATIKHKLQEMYDFEEKRYNTLLNKKFQLLNKYQCISPNEKEANGTKSKTIRFNKFCEFWNATHKYEHKNLWKSLVETNTNENDYCENTKMSEKKWENFFELIHNC
ncbi:hypothetical protein RFI_12017 [Reticulomyxa filosa]|uniref:histone acetyltransferase n=1 Tax=Reticulomyxa filosa TaxID=46433 RepID=X6NFN1_RETFI|nr:hypothetical protein RFI_12017 [Reticulomyxa filosa]|eukprot:ETO25130.1 hypothetical protein RFI_12017 [Reticulomyxa filosa]